MQVLLCYNLIVTNKFLESRGIQNEKSTCYHGIWYAVMKDSEDDDWSLGSYDLQSAIDILNDCGYENGYILKIDETIKTALEVVYEANQSNL